jgi:hypothetical protein
MISTAISATVVSPAEGVAVATCVTAGALTNNHAEGIALATGVTAGALTANHAEGVVGA